MIWQFTVCKILAHQRMAELMLEAEQARLAARVAARQPAAEAGDPRRRRGGIIIGHDVVVTETENAVSGRVLAAHRGFRKTVCPQ